MITISAPGKLMLSGEWSILENGVPSIVLAINKRVYASIKESGEIKVTLKDFGIETKATLKGIEVEFENYDEKLIFTKHAIETSLNYIQSKGLRIKKFELETKGDISNVDVRGEQMKIGFGSSAAATVAIIGAILKLHNISFGTEQGKEKLFKLSIISHYKAQGKTGSGFDVAASVYGGAFLYKKFDSEFLEEELGKPIIELVGEEWPQLEIEPIVLPKEFQIMIGFTGKSASTTELVKKVHELKQKNREKYDEIIDGIKNVTEKLKVSLIENDQDDVLELIRENSIRLKELGDESGIELETKEHSKMREIALKHGAACKFSGAGGGDCSIGVCFSNEVAEKVKEEWKQNNCEPIEAKISEQGVREE